MVNHTVHSMQTSVVVPIPTMYVLPSSFDKSGKIFNGMLKCYAFCIFV